MTSSHDPNWELLRRDHSPLLASGGPKRMLLSATVAFPCASLRTGTPTLGQGAAADPGRCYRTAHEPRGSGLRVDLILQPVGEAVEPD
jgi:hypothetical protein